MNVFSRGSAALALLLLVAVTGCSTYARQAPVIRDALLRADYETALAEVEKIGQGGSELLYCYEKGLILREQGEYAASNLIFERAGQLLDELYTKSISREVAAVTVSETITKYRGSAFEAALINYYKILNYLDLGDVDGALVECRRLNLRLQMLRDAGETSFTDDPFLQYLTALVYERGREWESASVSYRAAASLYAAADSAAPGAPAWLVCDAAANARAIGDPAAAGEYEDRAQCAEAAAGSGRVAVLVEYGSIARLVETRVTLPIFENDRYDQDGFDRELAGRRGVTYAKPPKVKYWLSVALPAMEADPMVVTRAVVRAIPTPARERDGAETAEAALVEDLDGLAFAAFREKEADILLRAVARALAKYLATQAADDADEGLGALVNLLGVATEVADTRSWTTLPRVIHLARFDLEPGTYRIEAEVFDDRGLCVGRAGVSEVVVTSGGTEVHNIRLR